MNKDIKFPYYSGNIYDTKPLGVVTLEQFINSNKNPSKSILKLLDEIKAAVDNKDLKLKRELKHKLYSFTPSITIVEDGTRKYADVESWTGLMQIDLDGIETISKAKIIKQNIFDTYKEIICVLISPSGKGVKCLMKTTIPKDKQQYKALHKAMCNEFEAYGYLDEATKNAMLPLFLSADTDILYRDIDDCDAWAEEDNSIVEYVNLNDENNNFNLRTDFSDSDKRYYYNKVTRIVKERIESINDNGHTQLRSAGLILGSRSAAGYIDKFEAKELLMSLVSNNSYFSKGLSGYLSTANWTIEEGSKQPKYYK